MLIAVKGNKQLKIDETERHRYLNLGFDIAEERGGKLEIVQHSPSKTVPYAQFEKVQDENKALKEQIKTLEKQVEDAQKQVDGKTSKDKK